MLISFSSYRKIMQDKARNFNAYVRFVLYRLKVDIRECPLPFQTHCSVVLNLVWRFEANNKMFKLWNLHNLSIYTTIPKRDHWHGWNRDSRRRGTMVKYNHLHSCTFFVSTQSSLRLRSLNDFAVCTFKASHKFKYSLKKYPIYTLVNGFPKRYHFRSFGPCSF